MLFKVFSLHWKNSLCVSGVSLEVSVSMNNSFCPRLKVKCSSLLPVLSLSSLCSASAIHLHLYLNSPFDIPVSSLEPVSVTIPSVEQVVNNKTKGANGINEKLGTLHFYSNFCQEHKRKQHVVFYVSIKDCALTPLPAIFSFGGFKLELIVTGKQTESTRVDGIVCLTHLV